MDIITDKTVKYHIEKLGHASDGFIFVKDFYNTYISRQKFQIYKVIKNNSINAAKSKSNNLMLFHGTKRKFASGIL